MQGRNNQAECEKADEVLGVDLLDILKKRLKKSSVKEKYARGFEPATTRSCDDKQCHTAVAATHQMLRQESDKMTTVEALPEGWNTVHEKSRRRNTEVTQKTGKGGLSHHNGDKCPQKFDQRIAQSESCRLMCDAKRTDGGKHE